MPGNSRSLDDQTSTPEQDSGREWFAGGTDLITLARTGVIDLDTVVDLKATDVSTRPPAGLHRGGTDCPAAQGRNEHHALIGEPRIATQPSDLATVLVALDARTEIRAHDGTRRNVAVRDLLQRPTAERRRLHTLRAGETIMSVTVPSAANTTSTYLKAMDRATWQFALVGIATVLQLDDQGTVATARLVASGIDSVPRELIASAHALRGKKLSATVIEVVASHADDGLVPQSENDYKRALLRGLVRRSLEHLAG